MRKLSCLLVLLFSLSAVARQVPFGKGTLTVRTVARNAVRIQYQEQVAESDLPDWVYVKTDEVADADISVDVDNARQLVSVKDKSGRVVFTATAHELQGGVATLRFASPKDECLFGLGQFQDGYTNIRGLSRRLTQVNTQISVPMMLSSKGYGVLWNNYGLTEFNPCEHSISLNPQLSTLNPQLSTLNPQLSTLNPQLSTLNPQPQEVVNVTSTEGGKREVRQRHLFQATIDVPETADYSLLLDVGQKMARRHNLCIDGQPVIEMQNLWLPPTASAIVSLQAGRHTVTAELTKDDHPVLYYDKVRDESTLRSPVATSVDYTVFVGSSQSEASQGPSAADDIIATYRTLTGPSPLLPQWMLGYIHCRERFHSQQEIMQTAHRFRSEQLPVDVLVQDWQYWGRYGWNSMRFDEANYPAPKAMTDSLHQMDMRLMVSVWSKIDKNSEVGRQMLSDGYYIPGTDWIDFFNPAAAAAYWRNFSQRLVPLGIDAWWQDATEPENDDLAGRRVNGGRWSGEQVRNVYPLLVCKTVYEGLRSLPQGEGGGRGFILTRCGFPGIQRYGAALWSGDVGNDWETLRRQITAGLALQATGVPWWTYDAGGFFRPANQYADTAYHDRLLRWVQTSVYLPLMRVHGYMSNTEPWNYGEAFRKAFAQCLQTRYQLLPYIYSNAAAVSFEGSTLMRPLVFDFAFDAEALQQKYEYMFGRSLLVSPVVEAGVTEWPTYLPRNKGGWYELHTARHYDGGQTVTTQAASFIPVFARAGSIVPLAVGHKQHVADGPNDTLAVSIYPGSDAAFTLYEDDGTTRAYEKGQCSRIAFTWDDSRQRLTIGRREGSYPQMAQSRTFCIALPDGHQQTVTYRGKKLVVSLSK